MESIETYLVRRLREVGRSNWPQVGRETGVSVNLMRKIAYGDRKNPGIQKISPLYDWLRKNEAATKAAA